MASMTLAEFIKRSRDSLITGIAQDIYVTNPIWAYTPWTPYSGSGITFNYEAVEGDSQYAGYGDEITAKAHSVVEPITYRSTAIIGDAEVNNQQIAESGGDGGDLVANEIRSKAQSVGRRIQAGMAVGSGIGVEMNSFHSLCDPSQYTATAGAGGAPLTFERLDELATLVKSKDGFVDFYVAHSRDVLKIRSLYRALGGVPMTEVQLGDKTFKVVEYNGVPVFTNDHLSTTETDDGADLVGGTQSSIYAGVWDDGSMKVGATLVYPANSNLGIAVEPVGVKEKYDEVAYRVKSYCNFALFNRRGLARLTGISGA